jgi:hypothetical protein
MNRQFSLRGLQIAAGDAVGSPGRLGTGKGDTVNRPTTTRRRGTIIVYGLMLFVVFAAVGLLGMEWGRVQLSKTELNRACDAAARYAVGGIYNSTTVSRANWIGGQNNVDGQPLYFQPVDVEVGYWDRTSSTFTPNGSSPNAVRVTGRRTVPSMFGKVLGISDTRVTVQSVAASNVTGFGMIGLNYIKMSGNATSSYWSDGSSGTTDKGNIASNGNVTLSGSSSIHGDVYYGIGKSVSGGGTISGSTYPLTAPLYFPPGDAGAYATNNDNANIPSWAMSGNSFSLSSSKSVTLPGGTYYFNNFSMSGSSGLTFMGPATIYCYGSFTMSGSTSTYAARSSNLTLIMCTKPDGKAPGTVTLSGSSDFYASVYAPQSPVTLSGTGDIYGSVLGLSIDMTGTSNVHYDMNLDVNNGVIAIVK